MDPKIFIASSSEAKSSLRHVESIFEPSHAVLPWDKAIRASEPLLDGLVRIASEVDFAIIILTPDDSIVSRGDQHAAPRDNLIFEAGLFAGAIGYRRVFLLADSASDLVLPSDLKAIQHVRFEYQAGTSVNASLQDACEEVRAAIARIGRKSGVLAGRRLFQHPGYYPIDLHPESHAPSFNKKVFFRAIDHLREKRDEMAATDLVYLWEANRETIDCKFSADEERRYDEFVESYEIQNFLTEFQAEHEKIFANYKRIVKDLGDTLKGVHFEILLHDVRNPIRSIIAARNSEGISNRTIGDPSTRFVVQYVREQGRRLMEAMHDGEKVAYLKRFGTNKYVKATTIPIRDRKYDLVGILCVNIDIDAVKTMSVESKEAFFENYTKNSGETPAFEEDMFDK